MMEPEKKPKVRVVKRGGVRLKSGIITVEGKDGKTIYRCACDRCNIVVTVKQPPYEGKPFTCGDCRFVEEKGKPSTTVSRRGDTVTYFTLCDRCGEKQKTPFLPKKSRQFLCDGCLRTEPQRDPRPIKKDVQVMGTKKEPLYWVPCDGCATRVELKFAPRPNEPFFCFRCFEKRRTDEVLPTPPTASPDGVDDTEETSTDQAQVAQRPDVTQQDRPSEPMPPPRAERRERKPKGDKSGTRLFIQIECAICGRREFLDFHPSNQDEPICSSCFKPKSRRK